MRFFVPGRIEVVGKHTDYAGGRSLLCAVNRGFTITARERTGDLIRITSQGSHAEFRLGPDLQPEMGTWAGYPQVVARRLARNFPSAARRGVDIELQSDLPRASGMSSSSALVVGMFLVLAEVNPIRESAEYLANILTDEDLAGYLGTIENGQTFKSLVGDKGVGTFGGSEDHTAILLSREDRLVRYAYCPVRKEGEVAWPAGYTFAIASSGVVAEKTGGAMHRYNRASLLARAVLEVWHRESGRGDATLAAAVQSVGPRAIRQVLERSTHSEFSAADLLDRFEQFYVENEVVVPEVCESLESGDWTRLGRVVDQSQRLSETGLKNQVPETVFLDDAARELGAMAASAFGAGFGGSVWAMVKEADASGFVGRWRDRYRQTYPECEGRSEFFLTRPGKPAHRID